MITARHMEAYSSMNILDYNVPLTIQEILEKNYNDSIAIQQVLRHINNPIFYGKCSIFMHL